MTKLVKRLARVRGKITRLYDGLTFAAAAEAIADEYFEMYPDSPLTVLDVEVVDMETGATAFVKCERVVRYEIAGLRGGE